MSFSRRSSFSPGFGATFVWEPFEANALCQSARRAAQAQGGSAEVDYTFSWAQHYNCIGLDGRLSPQFELENFSADRLKGIASDVFKILQSEAFGFTPELVDSSNAECKSFRIKIS